jgi:hypothetical protein
MRWEQAAAWSVGRNTHREEVQKFQGIIDLTGFPWPGQNGQNLSGLPKKGSNQIVPYGKGSSGGAVICAGFVENMGEVIGHRLFTED